MVRLSRLNFLVDAAGRVKLADLEPDSVADDIPDNHSHKLTDDECDDECDGHRHDLRDHERLFLGNDD